MPGNIQSIERAATILRLLSGRNRRLGVVDIAGEMGLSKGTVHGLLRTLQSVGFVEQDEDSGKYYTLTQKGLDFINQIKKAEAFVMGFGLAI